MSTALQKVAGAALQKQRARALADAVEAVAREDLEVVRAARRAPQLLDDAAAGFAMLKEKTDTDLALLGWTREQLRIATHALLPKKDCPAYLHFAQERNMLRYRNGEGERPAVPVTVLAAPGSTVQLATFSAEQLAEAPVYDMSKDE